MVQQKKKVLDIVERDTWYFFEENYLTIMERHDYHQPHFVLLGKNETSTDMQCISKVASLGFK